MDFVNRLQAASLGMVMVISLQVVCACVFVWELLSSVTGGVLPPIPWQVFEIVQIIAAAGLIAGIVLGARLLRKSECRAEQAENRLRAASGAFGELVEERFEQWALTPAERDVALFAIKGMTTAEIASLRNTSEGTVKAQTASIYRKAGVSGRPQLISLFIEDLLDAETAAPIRQAVA
ncbi:helix-turn-helix transcriptional regulator [Marivivens niveibacter]|uniref:Helix-turn-helix transcriptional regulator n=1 Tax=Marivivens niveibacter TaxID=1930667 RepID=A0A251WZT4_9RHOB|nr:helix-turn-helix transcriptional regulator [Marivivens niveibacter]OUD10000.1 helix-turn-helix transcriptional regulator [Marivivens niveibacter]